MFDLDLTFVWTIVNLAVLYLVLKRVLFKRVTEFMDKRAASIKNAIDEGEAKRAEGESFRLESQEILDKTNGRRDEIIVVANQKAQQDYDSIVSEARREAAFLLQKTREELEREREAMMKSLEQQVAILAIAAATKIVGTNMDSDSNKALVAKFLQDEGVV